MPGILAAQLEGARVDLLLPVAEDGPGLTAADAVTLYRTWLQGQPIPAHAWPDPLTTRETAALRDHLHGRRQLILSQIEDLRGRDLACWCPPDCPCHADVLLEMANG